MGFSPHKTTMQATRVLFSRDTGEQQGDLANWAQESYLFALPLVSITHAFRLEDPIRTQ